MRTLILLLLALYFVPIYSVDMGNNVAALSIDQDFQGCFSYKYGVHKIDKEYYIRMLGHNVQSYIESKNWNAYKREEFEKAYGRFIEALKNDRLSADDFGAIYDSKGELSNIDEDDYWYDSKGNRISGTELRALSVRKQKRYQTFHANRQVVTYFNKVAKAIVNSRYSD